MKNYSGNPANVSDSLSASVNGCANNGSGLIRVQTSAAHNFATYDYVYISGVVGTTEADDLWQITVIDATHFDLVGSTFTNAYVSGGTAVDVSLTPYATMPDDGEPGTTAGIESSIQLLFDRTQYLAHGLATIAVTANMTFTVRKTGFLILSGCGGGGGGGGGAGSDTTTSEFSSGGGGGGGARHNTWVVPVTAGQKITIQPGAGGSAGSAGAVSSLGGDGGDGAATIVFDANTLARLATFRGGAGGRGGFRNTATNGQKEFAPGGGNIGPQAFNRAYIGSDYVILGTSEVYKREESEGGIGCIATTTISANARVGLPSSHGGSGSTAGADGTADGTYEGGGGGGGGGGGPFGSVSSGSGTGGAGSNGTAVSGALSASNGGNGAANSGEGGGGGGGCGYGNISGNIGGAGGVGGSGYVLVAFR